MNHSTRGGLPLAVSAAIAIQALASAAVLALTAIAPIVAGAMGVPPHVIGYQVSVVYVFATLVSIFSGRFVRKYGPARVSQLALLAGALGLAGFASGSAGVVLIGSVLIGSGYALTNPAASELLNRLAPPEKRNLIFSLKQTGVPLGGILAGLVLPGAAIALGWQPALLLSAVLVLVVAAALEAVRSAWDVERDPRLPLRANMLEGLEIVIRRPSLRALAFMGLLFSAIQLSLVSFIVVMLVEEFGWRAVEAGAAAAAVQAAGAVGRVFWGVVADRTRAGLLVLAVIGCLSGAMAALMPFLGALAPWLVLAVLCAFGAASIGWNGVMLAEAARLSPEGRVGPVAGGVLMLTFLGVVLGPALFAFAYELIGSYADTYAIFALSPLLGSIVVWQGSRAEGRARNLAKVRT